MSSSADLGLHEPLHTTVPAWGMSLVLHLILFLAIALLAPAAHVPQGLEDETRPAAIVLVQPTKDAAPTRYLSEETATTADLLAATVAESRPAAPAKATQDSTESELADLLPSAPAPVSAVPVDFGRPLSNFKGAGRNIPGSQTAADADAQRIAAEQAALRPITPTGPTASVSVFGSAPAEGRTFTFVLDRSASMGEEGLAVLGVAIEQLQAAIHKLSDTHKFQIIAYNQRPTALGPKQMTPATAENKELVRKFFIPIGAYGSTDHELALVGALAAHPDVLFLLTDGGDPFISVTQFKRLRDMAKGRTTIHCIQFGKGPPVNEGELFMRQLAQETGGSYTYVDVNR